MKIRHNLPTEPNTLIGRKGEVSGLRQRVADTRVVTLCGVGGIGKSRLALHLAGDLLRDFGDGVWFVELASVDSPDLVAERVAETIGIDPEPGTSHRDTVVEALRHQRVLLVLDNCEHLVHACAELSQDLVSGGEHLRVVATSREPLGVPGESVWRVPPLDLPVSDDTAGVADCAALRLFAERAAAARQDFAVTEDNAGLISRLCRELDGMPLAIELAAARVGVLSVEQIAERLADRFRLLTANNRLAPARQQTLRATMDWSYEQLGKQEQVLLRRLAIFADGWTLDTAEHVCSDEDLPTRQVLDLTAALVDKSLVTLDREVAGELRYRLLETIRAYAAERLATHGEEAELRTRHREHLTSLAQHTANALLGTHSWPERMQAEKRTAAEEENIRAALAWAIRDGTAEEGLLLCIAMREFWFVNGRYAEARSWMRRLLALDPERTAVSAAARAAALVIDSGFALEEGKTGQSAQPATEGLALAQETGQPYYTMYATYHLALAALRQRRLDEAEDLCIQTVAMSRQVDHPFLEGIALGSQGAIAAARGQFQVAQRRCEAALEVLRPIDHRWAMARIVEEMGYLAELCGDLDTAQRHYARGLELLRGIHSPHEDLMCLLGTVRLAIGRGEADQAHNHLSKCLLLCRQTGNRLGTARSLEAAARLAHHLDRPSRAARLIGAADALRETLGRPRSAAAGPVTDILTAAHSRLGEAATERRIAEGRALTTEDAIDYATGSWEEADERVAAATVSHGPSDNAGPLTPRELEIAALVARGLTNRGIAEELVISPATSARHVANILTKLGCTSRIQIATWAMDQRLID